MDVSSMLNPICDDRYYYRGPKAPTSMAIPYSVPSQSVSKRPKIPKDAPVFSEGTKTVGHVNYPPHEVENDRNLMAEHERFQVFPLGAGEIYKKGVRHIPYNSDKKDFLDKTGRDAFEMFQYTYRRPGEEKEYVVVWDYNVGLVRMTPFFKSCKFTKTVPAKALNQNPGLKDISYSITGGALVCQGYWMPYEAAKAIAATFCYDIRWALTPVFGNDFPSKCLPIDNRCPKFLIDRDIVRRCTAETNRFRKEGASYRLTNAMVPSVLSPLETPKMSFGSPSWKPKAMKQRHARPADIESGYGTDPEKNDSCTFSPQVSPQWTHLNRLLSPHTLSPHVSPHSRWTALNRPLSPATPSTVTYSARSSPIRAQPLPLLQMPTPRPDDHCNDQDDRCNDQDDHRNDQFRTKRTHSKVTLSDDWDDGETPVRPQTAGALISDRRPAIEGADEGAHTQDDIDAAELLVSFRVGGKMLLPPTKRTRRGSTM